MAPALTSGAYRPLVTATQGSFVGSLVEDHLRGTAFGVVDAINGVGDLVSSVIVGFIWSRSGPTLAMAYGGVLALVATVLLLTLLPSARAGRGARVKEV